MSYDRYCNYCGKQLEPMERCTCGKKSEDAPGGLGTTSDQRTNDTNMVAPAADPVKREVGKIQ